MSSFHQTAPGSGEAAPLRSPRSGPRSSRPCPGQPGEPSPDADLQRPLRPRRFSERQRPSPPSDSRVLCAALLAVDVTSGLWESHSFGSFGFVTSHVNRCRPGGLVSKMIGSELSCLILSCINTQTYIIQNTVYEVTHANKTIISGKRSMAAWDWTYSEKECEDWFIHAFIQQFSNCFSTFPGSQGYNLTNGP